MIHCSRNPAHSAVVAERRIARERQPMLAMFGFFKLFFGLTFFSLALICTVFWIWMLVDCAMKEDSKGNDKLIWILVILFTHWIGAAIYFFVRRPQRIREVGQ
jgi:hypothetical protein